MSFSKLLVFVEIIRPLNVLITFLSIAAASILAGGRTSNALEIALASLAGALIAGGGNVINDYFDFEIDKMNKPHRPLPRGAMTAQEVLTLYILFSLGGVLLNLFLNSAALRIACIAVIALYLYSAILKRTALLGNVLIGGLTGLAFIYGAVVVAHPEKSIVPATFAFLINLAREIIKDVEDLDGDKRDGAKTLPVRYGVKPALTLATVLLVTLGATTIAAYNFGIYNETYLALVILIDAMLAYVIVSMWKDWKPVNLNRLSMVLKLNMVVGLVAIMLGS